MSKVDLNRITRTYTTYKNNYALEANEYALIEVVTIGNLIRIEIEVKGYIPDVETISKVYLSAVEELKKMGGD